MPLPRVVIDALSAHLAAAPGSPDDYLFQAPNGGPVRVSSWRSRYWTPATKRAGLHPLRAHDLRHTAVAFWIAAGASPKEIANRAGHTSVVTVLDRYGTSCRGSEERVTDALDSMAEAVSRDGRWIDAAVVQLDTAPRAL